MIIGHRAYAQYACSKRLTKRLVKHPWKEGTLFLLQVCQTQTSYNSDPGHRYNQRVIQVNRLSQVLTHRDKVSDTEQQRQLSSWR